MENKTLQPILQGMHKIMLSWVSTNPALLMTLKKKKKVFRHTCD